MQNFTWRFWLTLAPLLTVFSAAPQALVAADSKQCLNGQICLDQGWSDTERNWWYRTSQGSRLLPLSWVQALETAGAQEKFFGDANMERLGYLPDAVSGENPFGLPVGFVVDRDPTSKSSIMCDTFPATCTGGTMKERWVGLNCSACHTNDIVINTSQGQSKKVRIDGAPTLADFQGLEEDLLAALKAIKADTQKFDRFKVSVLGANPASTKVNNLNLQLDEQIAWQQKLHDKNEAPKVRYGHGRLDAQGHILNKVALTTRPQNLTNMPFNSPFLATPAADAPASYPFIWNTSQQDKIQWNGIASNKDSIPLLGRMTDPGALVRNTSEVIGVFAHVETDSVKAISGYKSSARIIRLIELERQLQSLQSPQWPTDLLGELDSARVARGEQLFKAQCSTCHADLAPTDTTSDMKAVMTKIQVVKTDLSLACNTYFHRSTSGTFEGQKTFALFGDVIQPVDFTRNLLINATFGTILEKKRDILQGILTGIFGNPRPGLAPVIGVLGAPKYLPGVTDTAKTDMAERCLKTVLAQDGNILQYKARSLNGIWATAPYLHNGSVPTLYDLLLPSDMRLSSNDTTPMPGPNDPKRPIAFGVGSRVFDSAKVGFVSAVEDPANVFTFNTRNPTTQEPIPGNYNSGHDYGTATLSEEDRMALVEYMKSL